MSTAIGRQAEAAAAEFLIKNGHKILATNWRTRWCEIDIVSLKNGVIYFVEVKYRKTSHHGDGLDYITPAKLRQMHFAAQVWLASKTQNETDHRLAVVSMSGVPPKLLSWLDEL